MREVPPLAVDDQQLYDDITAAKMQPRRTRLESLRDEVLEAYSDYLANCPRLDQLDAIDLDDLAKGTLRHGFLVETAPLVKLRTDILSRTEAVRCPLCGISESSTLDHYLPKEGYPEFSFFSKNLVPACAWCNTKKRDKVLEHGTDARLFVHPYFDSIPSETFLSCKVEISNAALLVSFRLTRPPGVAPAVFSHLRNHFRELGLQDRCRAMSLEHISGQHRTFERLYGVDDNAARVATHLVQQADDWVSTYGENFWLTALYRALAECDDFCNGGFSILKPST